MKILKLIPLLIILSLFQTNAFSETKKDCDSIKADTGVKIYEKWKCKTGKDEGLGKKIKSFFKKKN